MKEAVKGLASSIDGHISYLHDQSKRMKVYHSTPSECYGDKTNFTHLPRSSKIPGSLHELDRALSQKQMYEYVFVGDFAPTERRTVIVTVRLMPQSRALRMTRRILLTLNSQYETLAQN